MTKHPTPWTCTDDIVKDANGESVIYFYTYDPETRAVLLRAAEMWEALQSLYKSARSDEIDQYEGPGGEMLRDEPEPLANARSLLDKIESEIAAGRKP